MVFLADEQNGFQRTALVAERPTGIDADCNRREGSAYRLQRDPLGNLEGESGKKPPVDLVGVLVDLDEVSLLSRHKTGDRGQQTDPVGAIDRHE